MDVKWGRIVRDQSQADQAARDGFDYMQPVIDLVANLGDRQFAGWRKGTSNGSPAFSVCPVPLPADVRVTQKGFNLYVWTDHMKKVIHWLAQLGCRKLVWSNGMARVLPAEGEVASLKDQVLQFLFMLCEVAGNFDMTVSVEPLGHRRTNFLNSMKEVSEFLSRVGKENLSTMVSLRELEETGLSLTELAGYGRSIDHVQLENPHSPDGERLCPRPDDGFDYLPFLRTLKKIGYSARVTLPEDADAAGLAYCRRLWDE